MKEFNIAFVDPIISSTYLATELHKYPIKTTAVFSLTELSEEEKRHRFHPELFDNVIYVPDYTDENVLAAANDLKKLGVQYVFYGYEASVPFADKVSKLVCPHHSNDISSAESRFDKYEMQEALRKAGILSIKQLKVVNKQLTAQQLATLKTWDFPVIVKPTNSSVSIGVKECASVDETKQFIEESEHILLHAAIADTYVVQEQLIGNEYIVDSFSLDGDHRIVSVHRYEKIIFSGHPIYRYLEIIDPQSAEWRTCVDYTVTALNALGLNNGFGHTELFLTKQGPCLVEVNPRISGASGFINQLAETTLHNNQVKTLFGKLSAQPYNPPNKLWQHGILVFLQNWQGRKITSLNIELIKTLSSYHAHLVLKSPGSYLDSPKTLLDTVAMVLLTNGNKTLLMEDYAQLIKWENDNVLF